MTVPGGAARLPAAVIGVLMSKRKQRQKPEISKQTDYYKLHTKAVDDLAEADESNSPEVSEEELRKYRSGLKLKIPEYGKLLFVKFWFAAATCFFFIWGLSGYLADLLDLLFVTGMALGIVTDMLTNPVLRFFEKTPGANARWMMFPKKGYITFPLNILYAYVVLFLVYTLYNLINLAIIQMTGAVDTVPLGVEPVLFGLFYLVFDLLLLKAKHTLSSIIHDAAKSTRGLKHD